MRPGFVLAGALLLIAGNVAAIGANELLSDPALEQRAREISKQLRCMVCQNQSIFDSNADLARDLRVLVRERVETGDSDDEVLAYVHARYGDYVLLSPPVGIHTALLWAAPVVFVALALLAAWRYLSTRARTVAADDDGETGTRRRPREGARP